MESLSVTGRIQDPALVEYMSAPVCILSVMETFDAKPRETEALDAILKLVETSRALARADQQQYGAQGAYAAATLHHVLYLDEAYDHLTYLQEWLADREPTEPSRSPALAAYQVHSYLREAVLALHYARHWAMLSASYHKSRAALESYEEISGAIRQAEALGEAAGREFLGAPALPPG